jgi:hypothetical protein
MRTFKTRWFSRFARREYISDEALREAIERAERGLIDADLGGGLVKQRIARRGSGRSGGFRTLIAFRASERAVCLTWLAKNELGNITSDEVTELRVIAQNWIRADQETIRAAIENGTLLEIENDA